MKTLKPIDHRVEPSRSTTLTSHNGYPGSVVYHSSTSPLDLLNKFTTSNNHHAVCLRIILTSLNYSGDEVIESSSYVCVYALHRAGGFSFGSDFDLVFKNPH